MNHDEAHGLRVQLATALRERDAALQRNGVIALDVMKLRAELEAMKDRDYEPIKKWIEKDAPEAVRRAYAIMVKAESERDALRGDVKRLRAAIDSLLESVTSQHGNECGEDSDGFCTEHFSEKPCSVAEARAALAGGGDRP